MWRRLIALAQPSTRLHGIALAMLILSAGCATASPAPPINGSAGGSASSTAPARPAPTRAVLAIGSELGMLSDRFETNTYQDNYEFMLNSPLTVLDPQGQAHPLLAAEQPSQDNGTWTVNPDGTMATTWKLRPGAAWQDGVAVSPGDFVFALKVYLDPGIPVTDRTPEQYISSIESLDASSFIIHWNRTYPFANQLIVKQMQPMPEHVLGQAYDTGDPNAFMTNPYWTTPEAFVGDGPYRLVEWERGIQLTFQAYDDFVLGRPKIDEIVFRVIGDDNTVVANLLGGQIDATLGIVIGLNAGVTIKNQWGSTGGGDVIATPVRWEYLQIQFDPTRLGQPALLDPRVRRAMAFALDLNTTADTLTQGLLPSAAEVPVSPTDALYPRLEQALTHYPYSQAQALALLLEAGWTKRGDTLVDATGQPFTIEIRGNAGSGGTEPEMHIDAADLAKVGMQVAEVVIPNSRLGDSEYRVTFPGMNATAMSIDVPGTMAVLISDQCAAAPRFVGSNRGCYKNPDYDRQYTLATSALDPTQRQNAIIDGFKIMTQDVGAIGEYYSLETIAVRKGLVGPGTRWPAQVGNTWNVQDWDWTT